MLCLVVAGLSAGEMAHAQLTVQITHGMTAPIPVAVVQFGADTTLPVDVAAVVEGDLARSGRFAPLPRASMLEHPTSGAGLQMTGWRLLKTDYLVIGHTIAQGNNYAIEFELYNVVTGERLLAYRVPAAGKGLRLGAHQVADLIYEKILGVPGVFATRIAYISVDGSMTARRWRLWVADSDGENSQPILDSREPIMSPAWSPDGTRLAYVSFEGHASGVYVQTVATSAREKVSGRAGINGAPAWAPDGRRLAIALSQPDGNVDVFVLDLASRSLLRITDDPAIDTEPEWAPDGRSLYFTSDRAGRPQIYRVTLAAGERPKRVTYEGAYNARPRVSPDGSHLAVVTLDQGAYHIASVDVATGRSRVLSGGRLDEGPCFAPNGQTIMYAVREAGHGALATVAVDGSVTSRISSPAGDVREPAWSPRVTNP